MSEIFCFAIEPPNQEGRFQAAALGACGHILVTETCSSVSYAKHILGVTSMERHEIYSKHFPEGFRVFWINHPDEHPGFSQAISRNQDIFRRETSLQLH